MLRTVTRSLNCMGSLGFGLSGLIPSVGFPHGYFSDCASFGRGIMWLFGGSGVDHTRSAHIYIATTPNNDATGRCRLSEELRNHRDTIECSAFRSVMGTVRPYACSIIYGHH